MTQHRVTARFLVGRATDNKNVVRTDVKEALVEALEARGYKVADGYVEVHVGTPRHRRPGLG
jgi:hypothetical protein